MIDAHTLEVLEFPRVLALAGRLAASPSGAAWVLALAPARDPETVGRRLDLTAELRTLMASPDGFPVTDVPEARVAIGKLEAAGVLLEAGELIDLARLVSLARRVRERLDGTEGECPLAAGLARELVAAPEFEAAVERTFDAHGEVLDTASPALKKIRASLREQRNRIVSGLESMAGGSSGEERTVTLRGDRYVLGVKAAEKSGFKGIVHDRSASGGTFFIEPVGLVEDNNRLHELVEEERAEIRRILARLSDMARGIRVGLRTNEAVLVRIDGHRALARLADRQNAVRPAIHRDGARLRLKSFRHPLLMTSRDVVPLDLELTPEKRILLVTGPNMGGKTVALKGVGLACVMAAAGFHLPAAPGTEVPILDHVTADIGDEQSIENDLSTFASHLRRWVEATTHSGTESLALLDEIGAGTDPAEGAALARAVLERLADGGGLVIATTHLGALKRFGSRHPGVVNGSMRFDPVTQRPEYTLDAGIPGQSRAVETARRMGMPESLLARAVDLIGSEEQNVQSLLRDLEEARAKLNTERLEAAERETEARQARIDYEEKLRRLRDDYQALKTRAAREGQRILDRASGVLSDAERAAEAARKEARSGARKSVETARARIREAREEALAVLPASKPRGIGVESAEVKEGDRLWAEPLASWVTVLTAPGSSGKVRVERGGVRVEIPVTALRRQDAASLPKDEDPAPSAGVRYEVSDELRGEVDLRGLTADEALDRLDAYLDGAALGALNEVRIIHGKGTGVLRQAVRKWLAGRPDVESHKLGESWEGGTGVTVARLK